MQREAYAAWTRKELRHALREAGLRPNRRLGQNFLCDQRVLAGIIDAANLTPGELVLEVGPGTGELTAALLNAGARVVAVEIDRGLARIVQARFAASDALTLLVRDALDGGRIAPEVMQAVAGPFKLVANLPYNAGTPLLLDLCLRADAAWTLAVATVQREVAARLTAKPSTAAYGLPSVIAQTFADVEIVRRRVPADVFWPRPRVTSAVIRMKPRCNPALAAAERYEFARFCGGLFNHRRKILRHALACALERGATVATPDAADANDVLAATGVDGGLRAESLSPAEIVALFQAAARIQGEPA